MAKGCELLVRSVGWNGFHTLYIYIYYLRSGGLVFQTLPSRRHAKVFFSSTHVDNIKMNTFYICRSYVDLSAALETRKRIEQRGEGLNHGPRHSYDVV